MKNKKKMPPWIGSKADKEQDKKAEKGMTPAEKKKFEKADAKMDKDKTLTKKEDTAKDKALAARIKAADKKKPKK
jgi:hypothetical protein